MRMPLNKIVLCVTALFALCKLVLWLLLVFSYIPETGGMSINVVYGIQHMLVTGELYTDPESAPFSIIQYMPLHYRFAGAVIDLFTDGTVYEVMVVNRLLCLIAAIGTAVITGWGVKKLFPGVQRIVTLLAGLLVFIIIPGIVFSRLDSLYLVFNTASFISFLFYVQTKENKFKWIIYASVFCALALLTKQTTVLLITFTGLWLLYLKQFKHLIVFAVVTLAVTSTGLLLLTGSDLLTFKLNVVNGLRNGINIPWFYSVIVKYYFLRFGIFILFAIYIAVFRLWKKEDIVAKIIGASVIWYFIIPTILCLKGGANLHYYLEFSISFFIGLAYLSTLPYAENKTWMIIALCLPLFLYPYATDKRWDKLRIINESKSDYAVCTTVAEYIKQHIVKGKYVLIDFHTENTLNLQLSQYALFPNREVVLRYTYPQGTFHFKKFNKMIQDRKVDFYITLEGRQPEMFLDTRLDGFKPDTLIGKYQVYSSVIP
jgi:hypothetical protein